MLSKKEERKKKREKLLSESFRNVDNVKLTYIILFNPVTPLLSQFASEMSPYGPHVQA